MTRGILRIEKKGTVVDEVAVDKTVIVIGRDDQCDLVMAHSSVSRRHVVLTLNDNGIFLKDLDSIYGTTVDGIKVTTDDWTKIEYGALIRLGHSTRSLRVLPGLDSREQCEYEIAEKQLIEEEPKQEVDVERRILESVPLSEDEEEGPPGVRKMATELCIPVTKEVLLGGTISGKCLSVLALDCSGTRLATGTATGIIKLYDFGGMDGRMLPFRELAADEGSHAVVALSFSPSGDRFLSCVTGPQPQIFDRDGRQLLRFNRGDPYVRDVAHTTGHTTSVTGGAWQPNQNYRCASCGIDGSVRLWDLCGKTGLRDWLLCETAIRVRDSSSRKAAATAMTFSADGGTICASASDGSLQLWRIRGRAHNYFRPDSLRRHAHTGNTNAAGSVISCVAFSPDGHILGSRADDGRLKLWDLRRGFSTNEPLLNLPVLSHRAQAKSNFTFSPDGQYIIAGSDDGNLECFDIMKRCRLFSLPLTTESHAIKEPVRPSQKASALPGVSYVEWHPRLQQIVCACTNGSARILYDIDISTPKGALLALGRDNNKAKRKRSTGYAHSADFNMAAIVEDFDIRANHLHSTGYAKTRTDAKRSRLPDLPLDQGQQGRTTGAKSTLSQFWLDRQLPENIRNTDPREALLQYADQPSTFRTETTAYLNAKGQPILDRETLEEAEKNYLNRQAALLNRAVFRTEAEEEIEKK